MNNGQPNRLFRNNGNLTFTDVAATYGVNNNAAGAAVPSVTSIMTAGPISWSAISIKT